MYPEALAWNILAYPFLDIVFIDYSFASTDSWCVAAQETAETLPWSENTSAGMERPLGPETACTDDRAKFGGQGVFGIKGIIDPTMLAHAQSARLLLYVKVCDCHDPATGSVAPCEVTQRSNDSL